MDYLALDRLLFESCEEGDNQLNWLLAKRTTTRNWQAICLNGGRHMRPSLDE